MPKPMKNFSRTIYKYDVPLTDEFELDMPVGAEVISVQVQRGTPRLWAMVNADPETPRESRRFRLLGTGRAIPAEFQLARFVGTFQMANGELVFHLFALSKVPSAARK
jgi:hypothetical protein